MTTDPHPAIPPSPSTPPWKTALTSTPSISTRTGLSNNFSVATEDTDTLVLTAPSGHFVDIRLPKSSSSSSFWAFTGLSRTTFYDASPTDPHSVAVPFTAHTVFTHEIDSKGEGVVDEGDMVLLPNGDVVEFGVWPDGVVYKEVWTGVEGAGKWPIVVAETGMDGDGEGEERARGRVIRIGNHVQGIVEAGGRVFVQRWVRRDGGEDGREEWKVDPRCDAGEDGVLPGLALVGDQVKLGMEFESGGNVWKIVEFVREG